MGGLAAALAIVWRGNRRQLLAWTVGLAAVFVAAAWSMNDLYSTPAELADYARATESGTALFAINGHPYGLDSIGGVIAYEFGFVSAIAFPLMGISLVNRMTRGEEQSGRMELLRAGTIGRIAPVAAPLIWLAAAAAGIAAVTAGTLLALGLDWPGAVLYPLSLALLMLCFGAAAALAAQIVGSARSVTAVCLAALVVAILARGVGDVGDNFLVWLSPIGWAEQTRAFGDARWWPVAILLGVAVLLTAASAWFADRRDLGEGAFASRRGPVSAGASLLHPAGFAIRQHRGAVITWSIIGTLVGAAFGALAETIRTLMKDNATLQDVLGGGSTDESGYLAFVVILLALTCAGFGLQSTARLAEEERGDRIEPLLAGHLSRSRWIGAQAMVLTGGTLVVGLTSALALGISDAIAVSDAAQVVRLVRATAAYLPAVLVLSAFAAVLYALRPRNVGIAWLAFTLITVIATLSDTLQLPEWARNISPLTWVGQTPVEPVNNWGMLLSIAILAALAVLAMILFRRRDIPTR